VLAQGPDGQRWFVVDLTEFDPDELDIWQIDHDSMTTLQLRATGAPRPFRFWRPGADPRPAS
jgi:hypothetical protein